MPKHTPRSPVALAARGIDLIAPDLVLVEVANVLWRSARAGRLSSPDAMRAFAALRPAFVRLEPSETLLPRALTLAVSLGHPVYDCLDLALAEREASELVTADARLIALGKADSGLRVRPLVP